MAAKKGDLRKPMVRRRFAELDCQLTVTFVHRLPLMATLRSRFAFWRQALKKVFPCVDARLSKTNVEIVSLTVNVSRGL